MEAPQSTIARSEARRGSQNSFSLSVTVKGSKSDRLLPMIAYTMQAKVYRQSSKNMRKCIKNRSHRGLEDLKTEAGVTQYIKCEFGSHDVPLCVVVVL